MPHMHVYAYFVFCMHACKIQQRIDFWGEKRVVQKKGNYAFSGRRSGPSIMHLQTFLREYSLSLVKISCPSITLRAWKQRETSGAKGILLVQIVRLGLICLFRSVFFECEISIFQLFGSCLGEVYIKGAALDTRASSCDQAILTPQLPNEGQGPPPTPHTHTQSARRSPLRKRKKKNNAACVVQWVGVKEI